jgi:hypothetical protein
MGELFHRIPGPVSETVEKLFRGVQTVYCDDSCGADWSKYKHSLGTQILLLNAITAHHDSSWI